MTNRLRDAFQYLKRVYRFHEYKRRDGSIIDKVRRADGTVTCEENEVNKLVLENLKRTQVLESEPIYESPFPFPSLCPLAYGEMDYIVSNISHGKAVALDGLSDCLFSPELRSLTSTKLANLWTRINEFNFLEKDNHFSTRLIPLNKLHPEVPTPKDCPPIAVQSALVKLLESRLKPKLDRYLIENLNPGQTGFIAGLGISVNQFRLMQQVEG